MLTWTAAVLVPASHSFAVEIDNGTKVLAENKALYALHLGNNGALAVLTLNGVAAAGNLSGESCATTSCSGTLTVADAAGDPIVNTSLPLAPAFDNGPLALASTITGTGTVTAGSTLTQPSASGTSAYTVKCSASTGGFLTSLTPLSATGSGDITSAEITGLGLAYPQSIAYAANEYTCSAGTTISQTLLYASWYTGTAVRIYAAGAIGAAIPVATISGASTGLNNVVDVALDASGRIYAVNEGTPSITVYAANPSGTLNEAPLATIAGSNTQLYNPLGVAFDSSGRIYVVNQSGIVDVYAANPVGTLNEVPLATISGSNTGLNDSYGIALDSSGRIYVSNGYSPGSITMYGANPSGALNEAPLATISGGSTTILAPYYVALDSSGRIYLANYGANTILLFSANPSGTVTSAPLATIGGGSTTISVPTGIAVDPSGRIYVVSYGNANVLVFAANPSGNVTTAPLQTIGGPYGSFGLTVH